MATSIPALVGITPGARVLVAGGTGTIGSGIVLSLLKQGARVVVPSRSRENFTKLEKSVPEHVRHDLSGIVGDLSSEKGAVAIFKEATNQKKEISHVIASLGGWWNRGQLVDQSLREFNDALKDRVTSNFLLLKAFLPYLNEVKGSTYTFITGNAGYEYLAPNTSLLCIASGARNALAMAARAEYYDLPVAVGEVSLRCTVHAKPDAEMHQLDPFNLGHDLVGGAITATVASRNREKIFLSNREEARVMTLHDTGIM